MLIKTTCYRYGDLRSENFELSESMEAFLDKLKSKSEWVVYHTEYDNDESPDAKIVGVEYHSVHSEGKYSYHSYETSVDQYLKFLFGDNSMPNIMIWGFADAPKMLQYSIGGDEDWVALVKKDYYDNRRIQFLEDRGGGVGVSFKKIDFYDYWLFVGRHS